MFISSFLAVNYCKLPKTVSTRIENEMHQELLDRCNKVGCRVSDYLKAAIEFTLNGSVDFDFCVEDNEEPTSKDEKSDMQDQIPIGRIRGY